MCGCGTLFCRRCSPSAVFCARCHEESLRQKGRSGTITINYSLGVLEPAYARSGHAHFPHRYHAAHVRPRPLTQRLLLEALFMTILSVLALAGLFGILSHGQSFAASDTVVSYGIDAGRDPVQRDALPFQTSIDVNGANATFTSDTSYSISARVQSVKGYHDTISPAVPYDLFLAWGQLAEPDIDSKLTWEQADRRGQVSGALGPGGVDLTSSYVASHVSNNHVIPANSRIRQGLATIKAGDLVRIDGRLVDIRMVVGDRILSVHTSKSRTDEGDGACEIIFVEHLRVNGQSY